MNPSASRTKAPVLLKRRILSTIAQYFFSCCAYFSIFTTFAIVAILVLHAWPFFHKVGLYHFFFDRNWTPLFHNPQFGIFSLLLPTLSVTLIACVIAIPVGTMMAIYLSEFARPSLREWVKPVVEVLGSIPTVVYGFFALLYLTPCLQYFMHDLPSFNLLSAGLVVGLMIVPYVCSIVEDAMSSVPMILRESAFGIGSTRLQTTFLVVIPTAFSGIASAYLLAISRAMGETMIVSIAGGMRPVLSMNPLQPGETMTSYIVQAVLGDLSYGSSAYYSVFAVGLMLFLMTLLFSIIGYYVRARFRKGRGVVGV